MPIRYEKQSGATLSSIKFQCLGIDSYLAEICVYCIHWRCLSLIVVVSPNRSRTPPFLLSWAIHSRVHCGSWAYKTLHLCIRKCCHLCWTYQDLTGRIIRMGQFQQPQPNHWHNLDRWVEIINPHVQGVIAVGLSVCGCVGVCVSAYQISRERQMLSMPNLLRRTRSVYLGAWWLGFFFSLVKIFRPQSACMRTVLLDTVLTYTTKVHSPWRKPTDFISCRDAMGYL